jgi:uncharacterized alkaline shock family protein YloU
VVAVVTDSGPGPAADPGQRGRLDVAERVAARVASIAAGEVAGVVSTGSALEGVVGRRYPKADAEVAGGHAKVSLDIAVAWAMPLATTAATVRERVRSRLHELVGLQVDSVDVTVARVVRETRPSERRVQ